MNVKIKLLLAAAFASMTLASLASNTVAASFSFEPSRVRVTSAGLLTFRGPESTLWEIRCSFSLGGTLHRGLIAKVEHTLIGFITEAAPPACSQGEKRFLTASIPWHIWYERIAGVLPERVTAADMTILRVSTAIGGFCLSESNFELNSAFAGAGGEARAFRYTIRSAASNRNVLPVRGAFCPVEGAIMIGTFNFSPTMTVTRR